MKRPTVDLTKFNETVSRLERMREHRKAHPTTKSAELYFDLLAGYFQRLAKAVDEGTPFVGCGMGAPTEIFAAMDLPQANRDVVGAILGSSTGTYDEILAASRAVGIRDEICGAHRLPIGICAKGWTPRPTVIVYVGLDHCDNMSKSAQIEGALYNVPTFFVDSTYHWGTHWGTEKAIQYMAKEYQALIRFLEEQLSRKFDWDKFKEAIKLTMRLVELTKEIHKLQGATPCPIRSMEAYQTRWIRIMYGGTKEAVDYCETLWAELKDRVERGEGVVPEERIRLISLFTAPVDQQKRLFGFLEKEHGAVIVAEPMYFQFGDLEVDPSKPLEAAARIWYNEPYHRYYGPVSEALDMAVKDAIESKADAGVYWFNSRCRFGGPMARIIKDTLREKVGIPTMIIEREIYDTSPKSVERIVERLDIFLRDVVRK